MGEWSRRAVFTSNDKDFYPPVPDSRKAAALHSVA